MVRDLDFEGALVKMSKHLEVINHNSTKQAEMLERQSKSLEKMNDLLSALLNVYSRSVGNDRFDKFIVLLLLFILSVLLGIKLDNIIGLL